MDRCVLRDLEETVNKIRCRCEWNVISRHLHYMAKNGNDVPEQLEELPSFYCLPKLHRKNVWFQVHCCFQ